jgi:hypothetical protein
LVAPLDGLVGIGGAAHEDAQFLASGWFHPAEHLFQRFGGVLFHQDGFTPRFGEATEGPVGQE